MHQVLIFSKKQSPRLTYVLDLLLHQLLGLAYTLTDDANHFLNFDGPSINYSNNPLKGKNEVHIFPHQLLFEEGIKNQSIIVNWEANTPFFFETAPKQFDIFAATFYLISRYEEYLPHTPDHHGRYPAKESLAFKQNFLDRPIIHYYEQYLKHQLRQIQPTLQFKDRAYAFLPSFDIDAAWAYKHKNKFRLLIGSIADLLKRRRTEFKKRWGVIVGKDKDPFDTYDLISKIHRNSKSDLVFFFLVGKYGKYDKNHSPRQEHFRKLIQNISSNYDIGIHPSYQSNSASELLQAEIETLASITGKEVHISRQHFLKLNLPKTYKNLIEAGIQQDFTMGYADAIGFRASIAVPFYWYDLSANQATKLLITPFQIMDGTLRQYMGLSLEASKEKCLELIDRVRAVNGVFSYIWHNSSLSDWNEWSGWLAFYEWLVQVAEMEK